MAGEAFNSEDPEFVREHDRFLQASHDRDYELCLKIKAEIETRWPGAFDQPFIKRCSGQSARPYSLNNKPAGGRHRWMFYRIYGDERCMHCGCQRPAGQSKGS